MADERDIADLAERSYALLGAADVEGARALADELAARAPGSREALLVAAAIAALEDPEAALERVDEAWRLFPKDPGVLLTKASYLLELSEEADEALPLLYEAVLLLEQGGGEGGAPMLAEARVLLADCLLALGDAEDALATADVALTHDDGYALAHLARAAALFTLCRLEEAKAASEQALARDRGLADAHHLLARVAQASGERERAERAFEEAHGLDPDRFPLPCRVAPERFLELLAKARQALPAVVEQTLEGSELRIEARPDLDALREQDEPIPPDVACLVEVSPVEGEESFVLDSVVVYQENVELLASNEEELLAALTGVITDEVVGALGLDEEEGVEG